MHVLTKTVRRTILSLSLVCAGSMPAVAQAPTAVDLELALLVDVSGSVSTAEFNLQRSGYANAFANADLFNNFIAGLPNQSIAVSFVYWSSATQQSQLGGTGSWFLVNSVASSQALGAAIAAFDRPFSGGTAPHGGLNFITPQFATNAFTANRWVIDVSGDGAGSATATSAARDAALAAGVDAINGLVILGETGLEAWYNTNIKGGTGAFVEVATDFASFESAVERKLGREISNVVPEPSTYVLMATGLVMVFGVARRRRAA